MPEPLYRKCTGPRKAGCVGFECVRCAGVGYVPALLTDEVLESAHEAYRRDGLSGPAHDAQLRAALLAAGYQEAPE